MLKNSFHKTGKLFIKYKIFFIAFISIFILISIIQLFFFLSPSTILGNEYEQYFKINNKKFHTNIPKNLNFADEKVPLYDSNVLLAIDKELSILNQHLSSDNTKSNKLIFHKRAIIWFPMIETVLKKNNIPDDFKYIALIESQLTNVVSPQGATGFWQLIESTAKGYGLAISDNIDERYNVEKSTEAACKYFNEAYQKFNNWTLVAASYNLGMTGLQNQLEKQNVKNYYQLSLTPETACYIYRVLAMKEIISRPKVYGFHIRKKDIHPFFVTKNVIVDTTIHDLSLFAISQNSNSKILHLFNPWLLNNSLINLSNKKYIIQFPKNNNQNFEMEIDNSIAKINIVKDTINSVLPSKIKKDTVLY